MEPKFLKLTKQDDKIYSSFRETFKDLDIKLLKEDDLKSDDAKEVGDTVRSQRPRDSSYLSFSYRDDTWL